LYIINSHRRPHITTLFPYTTLFRSYRLLLATIAIGIAVDDTIHVLTRFRAEFGRLGNYNEAMAATLLGVGQALIISSTILVVALDRKSTRLNSSHVKISYAVFCLKK